MTDRHSEPSPKPMDDTYIPSIWTFCKKFVWNIVSTNNKEFEMLSILLPNSNKYMEVNAL